MQKSLEALHPWAATLEPLTDEECHWPMLQLNILEGICGSWCSCGCFQIHQIHPNIILDIHWLACCMYHIWILGILRPGGGLALRHVPQTFPEQLLWHKLSSWGNHCYRGVLVSWRVCFISKSVSFDYTNGCPRECQDPAFLSKVLKRDDKVFHFNYQCF